MKENLDMALDMFRHIANNINEYKYVDADEPEFKADLATYIRLRTGLSPSQSAVILRKVIAERKGCSLAVHVRYADNLCNLFVEVNKAEINRQLVVCVVENDHRSCNSCSAQNYVSEHDTANTLHTDRLYEVKIGHMNNCLCADCIEELKVKLDEAMEGGDR